tara:strand:- start:30 stop:227 length:198 start_codon:yes stop_codon:yes gene_type:complete
MDRTKEKELIRNLPFSKENFELLQEELIKSTYTKNDKILSSDFVNVCNITRNFQEDMINEMDSQY